MYACMCIYIYIYIYIHIYIYREREILTHPTVNTENVRASPREGSGLSASKRDFHCKDFPVWR